MKAGSLGFLHYFTHLLVLGVCPCSLLRSGFQCLFGLVCLLDNVCATKVF